MFHIMCSIEKQNTYFYNIVFDVFQISERNNHVCRVYYSVVGLKICTIHCSVISVETVLFYPAISRPVVIFGPSFSCPAFSCPAVSCLVISCPAISRPANWSVIFTSCIFSQPLSQVVLERQTGLYSNRPVQQQ